MSLNIIVFTIIFQIQITIKLCIYLFTIFLRGNTFLFFLFKQNICFIKFLIFKLKLMLIKVQLFISYNNIIIIFKDKVDQNSIL